MRPDTPQLPSTKLLMLFDCFYRPPLFCDSPVLSCSADPRRSPAAKRAVENLIREQKASKTVPQFYRVQDAPKKRGRSSLGAGGSGGGSHGQSTPHRNLQLTSQALTDSELTAARATLLSNRHNEMTAVAGVHDSSVRELYHLNHFGALVNYDPEAVKGDNSDVWQNFYSQFDLLSNATDGQGVASGSGGLSRRTTRKQMNERRTTLLTETPKAVKMAVEAAAVDTPASSKGKDKKGKGKALVQEVEAGVEEEAVTEGLGLSKPSLKVKGKGKGKKGKRRVSMAESETAEVEVEPEPEPDPINEDKPSHSVDWEGDTVNSPKVKPKKGKRSSFAPPASRRTSSRLVLTLHSPVDPPTPPPPVIEQPTPPAPPAPKPKAYPASYVASGSYKRLRLTSGDPMPIEPTHPDHFPSAAPAFEGDLTALLESFDLMEEDIDYPFLTKQLYDGKPVSRLSLSERYQREAAIRIRIAELRAEGRLGDGVNAMFAASDRKAPPAPPHPAGHWAHLLEQGLHFSELVKDERARHSAMAKKVAKLVAVYWEKKGSEKEREKEKVERERVRKAKWTVREVRKKWKLAVNVLRARQAQVEKEEADRIAKEHLNTILQKSSKTLEAQGLDIAARSQSSRSRSQSRYDESSAESEEEDEEEDDEAEEEEEAEEELNAPEAGGDEADAEMEAPTLHADLGPPSRSQSPALVPPIPEASFSKVTLDRASPTVNPAPASVSTHSESATTAPTSAVEPAQSAASVKVNGVSVTSASPKVNGAALHDDDDEFAASDDEARADLDDAWEAEMEEEEQGGGGVSDQESEVEMAGLKEDATMSIQELMRKYGYNQGDAEAADEEEQEDVEEADEAEEEDSDDRVEIELELDPTIDSAVVVDVKSTTEAGDSDVEFDQASDEEIDEADRQLEETMEVEEGDDASDGEEDEGLKADADIPIEELRERYRAMYEAGQGGSEQEEGDGEGEGDDAKAASTGGSAMELDAQSDEVDQADHEEPAAEDLDDDETARSRSAVRIPFLLRAKLRPYQKAGLDWLVTLHNNSLNGILADEMGLGKTLQTISVLAHLACEKGIWGPHLVVVPTSVMLNWDTEFKKFFPGFKVLTYYGNTKERKEKRKGWNTDNAFHVVITSYQLVLADQHIFRRKAWYYLVLDEAHHIKNFKSKRWETLLGFNTQRRLLLTGTPLQNNLMELWSLLYFLMPPGIGDEEGPFASSDLFREWFSAGTERAIESGEGIDRDTVAKLHTVLRPYLLRRLKADVEKQMPLKYEHIIYCRLSKRQRFLYDDFMSRAQTRDTLASGNFMSIINCLMQLRKVCNHPDLFEVRPIVTSLALSRSPIADYDIKELLVRKRLLAEEPISKIDFTTLRLQLTSNEPQSMTVCEEIQKLDASDLLLSQFVAPEGFDVNENVPYDTKSIAGWKAYHERSRHLSGFHRFQRMRQINRFRCQHVPFLGSEMLQVVRNVCDSKHLLPLEVPRDPRDGYNHPQLLPALVTSYTARQEQLATQTSRFAFATPKVFAPRMGELALALPSEAASWIEDGMAPTTVLDQAAVKLSIAFPDRSLLQYDCGKLQELAALLRRLEEQGSRALIFTQMTKVLDILEQFLTFNGYRYLRLDGSTKVEQRQISTERFNRDTRIMAFISSTRAGGLGINLTGADTVVFYDSDWNPSMDRQCQDRCHRIGQTRDVHIYRFVSEHTIEENMLKKANQKKLLDDAVIQDGDFTTDYFAKMDWKDMLGDDVVDNLKLTLASASTATKQPSGDKEVRQAFAAAEDEEDALAAREAEGETEGQLDGEDFGAGDEPSVPAGAQSTEHLSRATSAHGGGGEETPGVEMEERPGVEDEEEDGDGLEGTVDGYMLAWAQEDWGWFDEQKW